MRIDLLYGIAWCGFPNLRTAPKQLWSNPKLIMWVPESFRSIDFKSKFRPFCELHAWNRKKITCCIEACEIERRHLFGSLFSRIRRCSPFSVIWQFLAAFESKYHFTGIIAYQLWFHSSVLPTRWNSARSSNFTQVFWNAFSLFSLLLPTRGPLLTVFGG